MSVPNEYMDYCHVVTPEAAMHACALTLTVDRATAFASIPGGDGYQHCRD